MDKPVGLAAANNASFCDAVCRSHGLRGRFFPDYWAQADQVIPLYPNMVTLTADGADRQVAAIEAALQRLDVQAWFVKDSFGQLPLQQLGFTVLLDAEWFLLPPAIQTSGGAGVTRARTEGELRLWEHAWGQKPSAWPFGDFVFGPQLLSDSRVAFLFREEHGEILTGLIAHQAEGAVGVSNWFNRSAAEPDFAALLTAAALAWSSLPLVGYTAGPSLEALQHLGAQRCGPCRIWSFAARG